MMFYLVSWANMKSHARDFDQTAYNAAFDLIAEKFGGLGDTRVPH